MIRFVAVVTAVTIAVFFLVKLSVGAGLVDAAPTYLVQSLLIPAIMTIVIYRYLNRVTAPGMFIQIYLLTMVLKLIAYGAYSAWMVIDDKAGANLNVLFFLTVYVIFTALEVGFLHRKISQK